MDGIHGLLSCDAVPSLGLFQVALLPAHNLARGDLRSNPPSLPPHQRRAREHRSWCFAYLIAPNVHNAIIQNCSQWRLVACLAPSCSLRGWWSTRPHETKALAAAR